MTETGLQWAAPGWFLPGGVVLALGFWLLVRGYARSRLRRAVSPVLPCLKGLGILLIVLCLAEPMVQGIRVRPGANVLAILADDSRSMSVRDGRVGVSRLKTMKTLLTGDPPWMQKVAEDFDLRCYAFDARLRAVRGYDELGGSGDQTGLGAALHALTARFEGEPLAGILLLTDGLATDPVGAGHVDRFPAPVYPVLLGGDGRDPDVALERVTVRLSHFETAPVTIEARVTQQGFGGRDLEIEVFDEGGVRVDAALVRAREERAPGARFELRPPGPGMHFYRVAVRPAGEQADREITRENNVRTVAVDRGRGPYRVLYVGGRPNWEFKFLRRALAEDEEIDLVGLLRIARREPKFDFRGRRGDTANPIFRGFGDRADDGAEQYDEPVLVRLGTEDEHELQSGFPRDAEELFRYDALILDDVEAAFFTRDQLTLIRTFVNQRGGGFLMLGGVESFDRGGFEHTPVGDVLPVYLEGADGAGDGRVRLDLTREGLAQTWVRLRKTESEERERLDGMPAFATINRLSGIKPGAVLLGRALDDGGEPLPALVTHRFGKGRAAAMTLGDVWRWTLRRGEQERNEPALFWRQAVRWLVASVPRRVEADVQPVEDEFGTTVRLAVRVRDAAFLPMDNAAVTVAITRPGGTAIELKAEAGADEAGLYTTTFGPRAAGPYRAQVSAVGPDGEDLPGCETGWVSEPGAREFRRLAPDRALLERLADASGGRMVKAEHLDEFAAGLAYRSAPETEVVRRPLWHRWLVLLLAVGCLAGEWGLRRWRGLP